MSRQRTVLPAIVKRIREAWAHQCEEVEKHKNDPGFPLKYPTWSDFMKHLAGKA